MSLFTGSGVAIITPFNEDKSINFDKFAQLIEFQLSNKTDAIVVAGTTGESTTLSDEEQLSLIEFAVKTVNKRVPVIAGTGSNDTLHSVKLSKEAERLGVDGLLVITPYYNKTNKSGLIAHFKMIAESVKVPVILYNVPGRTGMSIGFDVLEELAKIENIVGIKEASGDITYASDITRIFGERFDIYSGNDDIILPIMAIGGKGVISVLANPMPLETHDIVMEFLAGNVAKSREIQMRVNGFVHSLFCEVNPIPVKTAMNLLGFGVGGFRMPLNEISESGLETLKREMKKVNLI